MSAREWLSAPWWEQRLLLEGLTEEGIVTTGDPDDVASDGLQSEQIQTSGGVTVTDRTYSYDLSDAESLPEGDFTVGTIG